MLFIINSSVRSQFFITFIVYCNSYATINMCGTCKVSITTTNHSPTFNRNKIKNKTFLIMSIAIKYSFMFTSSSSHTKSLSVSEWGNEWIISSDNCNWIFMKGMEIIARIMSTAVQSAILKWKGKQPQLWHRFGLNRHQNVCNYLGQFIYDDESEFE